MATAVLVGNGTIQLSAISADWSLASSTDKTGQYNKLGNGIFISYIRFEPQAASDTVVIKDTNDSGPIIAHLQAASTNDMPVLEINAWKRPYLDYSLCKFGTGAKVWIDFL